MRRRAVLATLGAVTLAGCGWSQEEQDTGPAGSGDGGTPTPVDLAESEGGEESIEADPEELLLGPDAVGPEWTPIEIQRTGVCNAFERGSERWSFVLETCAAVYDDEETAIEEYESDVETSATVLTERPGIDAAIGDEADVFGEDTFRNESIRVRFRDTNATGLVDFTNETFLPEDQTDEIEIPERDESDVVEWAATMHEEWRS